MRLLLIGILLLSHVRLYAGEDPTPYKTTGAITLLAAAVFKLQANNLNKDAENMDRSNYNFDTGIYNDSKVNSYHRKRAKAERAESLSYLLLLGGGVFTLVGFTMKTDGESFSAEKHWRFGRK